MMSEIGTNLESVRLRIREIARSCGRRPDSIRLLAVSKAVGADSMQQARIAGQNAFGENYVDEALEKMKILGDSGIEWHFIGKLQSNKTRDIAMHFDWVHSIDNEKAARRLSNQRPDDMPPLNACIQINISAEPSKSGITPGEALPLATIVNDLPRLRLRGIMGIPAATGNTQEQRQAFRGLRHVHDKLLAEGLPVDTLSMGMTADMEAAIHEGATIVRIGTAIFGPRTSS